MKEFETRITESLHKGLRKHHGNFLNVGVPVKCLNTKPSESGLIPIVALTYPITDANGALNWPFPQIFGGVGSNHLATETAIYLINANWSITSKLTGLAADEIWDWADYGSYILGTNGSILVQYASSAWTSFASATDIPRMSTLCDFKGQLIGGNVKTTWNGCGTSSLIWSEIGNAKFTPTKLNTAGFRNIPWPGDVLKVKRLGDLIVVYGDQGIGMLVPVNDPIATYGFKEVLNIGLASKGAVGGDEHSHVFVDKEGWLWGIEEGQTPKRLGYQEFFSALTAADIMISLDPSEQEFYISDGSKGYLLTPWGLCETYQRFTSLFRSGSTTYGPVSDGSDTSFTLTTDTLDYGLRGFKTMTTIELGVNTGEVDQGVDISVYYRSNKKSAFSQSSWIHTNPNGVAMPVKTAEEFRISVKADSYLGMKLDYINARIKLPDRRFVRGIYAMQAYAEAQKG